VCVCVCVVGKRKGKKKRRDWDAMGILGYGWIVSYRSYVVMGYGYFDVAGTQGTERGQPHTLRQG
jgi:hypothetical protein